MIITKTPFRISFFGGGTDYPAWYREHGGTVIGTTIDKYCYLSVRTLPPFFDHRIRVAYSRIELCKTLDEIQHPSARECLRYAGIDEGIEIHHDADLPARTGIGSSSSFTVGLLKALYALKGVMIDKQELLEKALHMEQEILKENVGSQDQAFAAWGGFNRIHFKADGTIDVQPMTLRAERIGELESHLMLFFTGFSRIASQVAGKLIRSMADKRKELETMHSYVREAVAILNGDRDIREFGTLLHENWLLKRDLAEGITMPEIDQVYETARKAGAIGGKILGAGGGGFLLLFVEPELRNRVRQALGSLLHVPFRFSSAGSHVIVYEPNSGNHVYLAKSPQH